MTQGDAQRWFRENAVDTRRPGGPAPRLYAAPFSEVWDALVAYAKRRLWWRLAHHDEDLGLISVHCVMPGLNLVDDLTIWVALDENGLTRVDAFSRSRRRNVDLGMNRRRIRRMLGALDRTLDSAPLRDGAPDPA